MLFKYNFYPDNAIRNLLIDAISPGGENDITGFKWSEGKKTLWIDKCKNETIIKKCRLKKHAI